MSEWIKTGPSLSGIAAERFCTTHDAMLELMDKVRSGAVAARDADHTPIAPGEAVAKFFEIEIRRSDLDKWLGRDNGAAPYSGAKRGPKGDWSVHKDAFWVALCVNVHEHGFPLKQSDLVKRMRQWFIAKYDDHPGDTWLKDRVRLLYSERDREVAN